MKLLTKIIIGSILIFLTSCVNDIDFDQVNKFEFSPTYAISLVKFSLDKTELAEPTLGSGLSLTNKEVFTAFEGIDKKNNLEKIQFEIEINNPFNRGFVLNFSFFDKNGELTYTYKTLKIEPNTVFKDTETIFIANNPKILESTEFQRDLELLPGTTAIDAEEGKKFTFKSGGVFQYTIR